MFSRELHCVSSHTPDSNHALLSCSFIPFNHALENHKVLYGHELIKTHVHCERGRDVWQLPSQGN